MAGTHVDRDVSLRLGVCATSSPEVIVAPSFQTAWLQAVGFLAERGWAAPNLIVQISDPCALDDAIHQQVCSFAAARGLLGPKHVAYTIFPHRLYEKRGSAEEVFRSYNRPAGMYERLRRRAPGWWGTYFRRMTHYETAERPQNQLQNIISAVLSRKRIYRAAYTIALQKVGPETIRPLGGPCLDFLAVQLEGGTTHRLGLMGVYRNQDFLERAYGNYWGLCNLLTFLAAETHYAPGALTCVSSRAYVSGDKRPLKELLGSLG